MLWESNVWNLDYSKRLVRIEQPYGTCSVQYTAFIIASDCSFRNLVKKGVKIASVLSDCVLTIFLICCLNVFIFHFCFPTTVTERLNLNHICKKKLIQQQSKRFFFLIFLSPCIFIEVWVFWFLLWRPDFPLNMSFLFISMWFLFVCLFCLAFSHVLF